MNAIKMNFIIKFKFYLSAFFFFFYEHYLLEETFLKPSKNRTKYREQKKIVNLSNFNQEIRCDKSINRKFEYY